MERRKKFELPELENTGFEIRFERGGLVIVDNDPLFGKPRVTITPGENMADAKVSIIYTSIDELAMIVGVLKRYHEASHDIIDIKRGKIYIGGVEKTVVTKIIAIHGRKLIKYVFIYRPTIPIF